MGVHVAFLKSSWGVYRLPGGFKQAIYNSHTTLKQLLPISARGLRKSLKIKKHFARGKIRLYHQKFN
jgi:hypothetical protein